MFCKKCGKELDASHKFCTQCGSFSSSINNSQTAPHQASPYKKPKEPWTIKRAIKITAIVLVVGFLLVLKSYNLLDKDAVETSNKGLSAYESGDKDQAIVQFQQASQDSVTSENKINILKNLAYVYISKTQNDLALTTFKEALALTSLNSFDYYLISGEIAELEGKPNAASLSYNKAYEINPDDFQINNTLALFYMDLNDVAPQYVDYPKALTLAKKAHELDNSEVAKNNLAIAYYFNGRYDLTVSMLSTINFDKQPTYAYWIGLAYAQQDDKINARKYLQMAIDKGVKVPQEIYDYLNVN